MIQMGSYFHSWARSGLLGGLVLAGATDCGRESAPGAISVSFAEPQRAPPRHVPRLAPAVSANPAGSAAHQGAVPASSDQPVPGALVTVEGILEVTKGHQAQLQGYLINRDQLRTHLGVNWAETLVGKRVRARGRPKVVVCGLTDQCLLSGKIQYFEHLENLDRRYSGEPCLSSLRDHTPCRIEHDYCVEDMGAPCGHSTRLMCVAGSWSREEEKNLCR